MRITLLIANFLSGGAENVMVSLANNFAKRGHEVELLIGQDHGPLKSKVHTSVNKIVLEEKNIKKAFSKILFYLKKNKPDILLSTKVHINTIAILATKLSFSKTRVIIREASTPSVDSVLAGLSFKIKLITFLSKWIYKFADGYISVSEGVKKDMVAFYKLKPSRITSIYNPMISIEFKSIQRKVPDHPWFLNRERILIAMGRVVPAKDFMTLVKAFKIVKSKIDCKLMILGDTTTSNSNQQLFNELTNYIEEENLQNDVSFLGFKKNPVDYLLQSEIFILSSIYEGLPGALIQALAVGCKIVSTDCPSGPREILKDGEYGRLVPVKDPSEMAKAILHQLESKEVIKDGYEKTSPFHLDKNVNKYLQYFEEKRAH